MANLIFLTAFFAYGICGAALDKTDHIEGKFREFINGQPTGRYLFLTFDISNQQGTAGHSGEQEIFEMINNKEVRMGGLTPFASGDDLDSNVLSQIQWTPGHRLICQYYPLEGRPMLLTAARDPSNKEWNISIEGVFRKGLNAAGEKWEFRKVPMLPIEDKSVTLNFPDGANGR